MQEYAWAVWLAAAMALGVAELFSVNLILLMLSAGCLVGMGAALLDAPVLVQMLGAAATATAMLALVRPSVVRQLQNGPGLVHGTAALLGQEGFALAEVNARSGQVKLGGEVWTARPYDEFAVIPAGAKVEVFEIRGATAYVHEIPELGS